MWAELIFDYILKLKFKTKTVEILEYLFRIQA